MATTQAMYEKTLNLLCWLLFCTMAKPEHFSGAGQRWRLLLWALLVTWLWGSTKHNLVLFALVVLTLCLFNAVLTVLMCANGGVSQTSQTQAQAQSLVPPVLDLNLWEFPTALALLSAASLLASHTDSSVLSRLLQKLAIKEYTRWQHWCPNTHVTICSVIIITCAVQGVPRLLTGVISQSIASRPHQPIPVTAPPQRMILEQHLEKTRPRTAYSVVIT